MRKQDVFIHFSRHSFIYSSFYVFTQSYYIFVFLVLIIYLLGAGCLPSLECKLHESRPLSFLTIIIFTTSKTVPRTYVFVIQLFKPILIHSLSKYLSSIYYVSSTDRPWGYCSQQDKHDSPHLWSSHSRVGRGIDYTQVNKRDNCWLGFVQCGRVTVI